MNPDMGHDCQLQETKKEITAKRRWEEKLLQRTGREREKENNTRSREVDGRLAILMLTMLTGPAQQERHTRNRHKEDREYI